MDDIEILAVIVVRRPNKERSFDEVIYYKYNGEDYVIRGGRYVGIGVECDDVDDWATTTGFDRAESTVRRVHNAQN